MKRISTSILGLVVIVAGAHASLEDLLKQVIDKSPAVASRRLQLEAARLTTRSLESPATLEVELSPGVGFNNSNVVLNHAFDISGIRAARAARARAQSVIAEAQLQTAQIEVISQVLKALADYQAALDDVKHATASLEGAEAILAAVEKRLEIGEAPAVQVTRAEVEVLRARQLKATSENELANSKAAFQSLTGADPTSLNLAWPSLSSPGDRLITIDERHPKIKMALAEVEAERASEREAKRRGQPTFSAGVAADVWSLDRRPRLKDNVGLQFRIAFPLDLGEHRKAVRAAQAVALSRESDLKEVERELQLELAVAQRNLAACRAIADNYATGILPKAEQMFKAMQMGLASGLTQFADVLETQRTLIQLKREATAADKALRLAELRLRIATSALPGMESSRS